MNHDTPQAGLLVAVLLMVVAVLAVLAVVYRDISLVIAGAVVYLIAGIVVVVQALLRDRGSA